MAVITPERVQRYAVVHAPRGPRLRLAVLWLVLFFVAFYVGSGGLAMFFAVNAAIAALQMCARWNERRVPANGVLAAAGAAAVPLAAWVNNRVAGLVILGFVALAVLFGSGFALPNPPAASVDADDESATRRRAPRRSATTPPDETSPGITPFSPGLGTAWVTLAAGFIPGLAAAAVVQSHRIGAMALAFLASAVCTYDAGDYLCSAGYASRRVGPLSGMFGVLVVTMSMSFVSPAPLVGWAVWLTGLVLAVLCPLGQWLGSWMLPASSSSAPGIRRLDAWFLAAPVFWLILVLSG